MVVLITMAKVAACFVVLLMVPNFIQGEMQEQVKAETNLQLYGKDH